MWTPWVGKNYNKDRILILGESSYTYKEDADGLAIALDDDHPVRMVEGQLEPTADDSSFMTMLTNALTDRDCDTVAKRHAGWAQVAFTNYVPVSIGTAARQRPDAQAWGMAKAEWPMLLERLSPRHVIVLGLGSWDHIPKGKPIHDAAYTGPARDPAIEEFTLANGQTVLCWCHWHPSAGASWESIRNLIRHIKIREDRQPE
ncbi:hypothetical protein [Gluconobacter roseus]|uniref:Uracil-DNA glycosylase-like domain-containing protein n=1 Tax=Gluconobacter roseus NBRC 3990 TaxID=1307950 RepID=A0A4Y3M4I0_9PROT|nr:hypothetical protein [Gluconobacter roseus]GBR45429.1 hypothetical protein AA3990_1087 [Gluconobacter roseus NBRC 3990]GEB02966.1 hypothetical protein GRO01_05420 [Gluconobacter roseus NBRC 3990]GLP93424.1 hypothetical protein GCM10007871_14020 [Gluconobacter roseus NBRC 3990]